jgi:hypothetical protein
MELRQAPGKHCTFAIIGVLANNTTGFANVNRLKKAFILVQVENQNVSDKSSAI